MVAVGDERAVQKNYWMEHSANLTVESMMLDSKAVDLDKEERPEVSISFSLFFFTLYLFILLFFFYIYFFINFLFFLLKIIANT